MQKSLLVIGAGPAGTSAAISAALAGVDTMIVDALSFPRHRPGETLHPGIQPLMAQLGVEARLLSAGFVRHEGTWVLWNGERRFEAFGRDQNGAWQGFQAWRADFDAILLARAREVGVEILQPCRVIEPIVHDGCLVGVTTSRGPIQTRSVIDAAGGNHWLARNLDVPIETHSPKLIACYGYESTSKLADRDLPAIVADRAGWTWRAKIRPDLYHWTRLPFDGKSVKHMPSKSGSQVRGADVTWRCVALPAGRGYFCTGDAACVLDPASSHGVLRAVMTGMMAARVQRQISAEPAREPTLIDGYNRWIRHWFQHDLNKLQDLYRKLPNPPSWIGRRHR